VAQKSITEMKHSPYFPDSVSSDFWLFPRMKSALKGQIFQDIEDIQENAIAALKAIQQQEFQKCFQQWQLR
jgi:hypothetical protein